MDCLLPENPNYNKVLTYMQHANQQSFDRAKDALQRNHYDLEAAIAARNIEEAPVPVEDGEREEAMALQRYLQFLQRKKKRSMGLFGLLFYGIKWLLGTVFRGLASIVLPRSLLLRVLYPRFHSLYDSQLRLPVQKTPLKQLLLKTKNLWRKSVLLAVSGAEVSPALVGLLNTPRISESVAVWFNFTGLTVGDGQLAILGGRVDRPQIIVCRMDVFEEVVVIARFSEDHFQDITPETLKKCYEDGVGLMERGRGVLKLYRRFNVLLKGGAFASSSEDEEQYQRPQARSQVAQQNEVYHALEEKEQELSRLRRRDEQRQRQERQRQAQAQQLRKVRLLSIPAEPKEGDFVRISFRCPDGNTIMRNFASGEKVELIYSWVQVNEEMQFESSPRSFELMHSYPLRALAADRERSIGEVFEDEQEKVVVREL